MYTREDWNLLSDDQKFKAYIMRDGLQSLLRGPGILLLIALGFSLWFAIDGGNWYKRRVQVLEDGLEKGQDWVDLGPNLKGRRALIRKFEEAKKWNESMIEHYESGEAFR